MHLRYVLVALVVGFCSALQVSPLQSADLKARKKMNLGLRGGGNMGSLRPRDGLALVHAAGTLTGVQCLFAPTVSYFLWMILKLHKYASYLTCWIFGTVLYRPGLPTRISCTKPEANLDDQTFWIYDAQHKLSGFPTSLESPFH